MQADSTWGELRGLVFGDREIRPAPDALVLTAPARPDNQSAVPVRLEARISDGRAIRAVTFVVDENPSPVAAVFEIAGARRQLDLATRLRLNAATEVRAVVELDDGALLMASRFVKFAGGQAACAAPPAGDPAEIAATMGQMRLDREATAAGLSLARPKATLTVRHPNHTGMVLDQVTLLYVPLRIVSDIEVHQGGEKVFSMTGSITLSQDPQIGFDYVPNGADTMTVTVTDTDGARWERSFQIGSGS
ncbi:quinoprotein dehydrogenase-associated SoxYZ-like carrier [Polymorphum gilvum]|uniref:quinoprotein dehydrogenase-associated SoxYZ-like carrier n=1 Tax=Polymorphum gilvum TaxID=991904 RepID=UPI0002D3B3E2|nr:quinoprotein dehydrogenase-associated SoxYZ-like carrier [Polymorphum gilvum]